MKRLVTTSRGKLVLSAMSLAILSGCASVSVEQNVDRVNEEAKSFTEGQLSLARTGMSASRELRQPRSCFNRLWASGRPSSWLCSTVRRCRRLWRRAGLNPPMRRR